MAKHDINVSFGGVAIGDETFGIGFKVERETLDLEKADELFATVRLSGRITLLTKSDEKQKSFDGMEDEMPTIESEFDVRKYAVSAESFSGRLVMPKKGVDIQTFMKFRKKVGRLVVTGVDEIVDEKPEKPKTLPGQKEFSVDKAIGTDPDEGSKMPVSTLETKNLRKLTGRKTIIGIGQAMTENICNAIGGKSIGKLEKFIDKNDIWHESIIGVGEEAITKIEDAIIAFRKVHPLPEGKDLP